MVEVDLNNGEICLTEQVKLIINKLNEIAESEKLSANKVKYTISNSLKIISANVKEKDRKIIEELLV